MLTHPVRRRPRSRRSTFPWKRAAEPLISLQAAGHFATLAYLLAIRADLDGAREWMEAHPEALQGLERAIFGR